MRSRVRVRMWVRVWVRVHWTSCEVRQRRKGRQFVNVMCHIRQSRVDHRLRVEAGLRAHTASRRWGREGRARSGGGSGHAIASV
jgi:hypothetical protein